MKFAEHVPGQLIPAGELVTVPAPTPAEVTVSCDMLGGGGVFPEPPDPGFDPEPPVLTPVSP